MVPSDDPGVVRPPARAAEWVAFGAAILLTAVAANLRLPGLEYPGLWLDEILGVFRAQSSPLTTSWTWSTDPQHGPLFHGMLWVMDQVHPSEAGYRLPFAVLGVLTVPVAFVVARDLGGPAAGVLGAAMLASAPLHVYLSRECRPYGALVFLQALALACGSRQLVNGPSRGWRHVLLATTLLLLLLSSQGIWYVLVGLSAYACALIASGREAWRDTARTVLRNGAIASALFVALHGFLLIRSPDAVGTPPITPQFVARMFNGMVTGIQEHLPVTADGQLAAVAGLVSLIVLARLRPRAALVYLVALLAGIVLPFVLLKIADHGLRTRFMLAGTGPFALLVGTAAGAVLLRAEWGLRGSRVPRALASTAAACLLAWPVTSYYAPLIAEASSYKPDWRRVALLLKDQARPGDLVLTSNDWARVNLLYHLPRAGLQVDLVSAEESVAKAEQALAARPLAFLVSGGYHASGEILRWQARFPELMAHRNDTIRVSFFPDRDTLLAQRPSMRQVAEQERALRERLSGILVPGLNADPFLLDGWGDLERGGRGDAFRWLGRRARIYVPVADTPPAALHVDARPLGAIASVQRMSLRLNQRSVWTGALTGPVDIGLPGEFWKRGGNFLDLEFALAGRPVDLQPGSNDARELAASVSRLALRW
jgi:hypothetical protein